MGSYYDNDVDDLNVFAGDDAYLDNFIPSPVKVNYDTYNDALPVQPQQPNYQPNYQQPQYQYQQPQMQAPTNLEESDFPSSKFGDISVEAARAEFKRETSITPFGANGKTMEILGQNQSENNIVEQPEAVAKKSKKQDFAYDGQITLDELMEDSNNYNDNQPSVPEYDSPLKRRLPKNNMEYD
ncbi:hypothetical protein Zmor_008984 [Zophobas morio]|uniref:Uncharacterized protein n=1 Tax=Zophobas morio TaxID=2755281 RepID=A0AA38HJF6_9CUCU|nr:hypothetical protein Zmor_008984 [Zophobas morio]